MSKIECVQCSALTRSGKGKACKNRACATSEFCAAHTRSLFDLYLKPSSIPRSGKGIFTSKAMKKNQNIARYTGVIKTKEEFEADPSDYGIEISRGRVVDAVSTQSAIGRYANDCRTADKNEKH